MSTPESDVASAAPAPVTERHEKSTAKPGDGPGTNASATDHAETRRLALRGSVYTLGGYAAAQLVRLASNLLLSRLLSPDDFGLTRIPNVVLLGVHLLSDIGIGTAIIQSKRGDDPRVIDTAFSLQALRGVYVFLAVSVLGFPLAWWYGQPDYRWMMPLAGATALFDGLSAMALFTANRALRLGRITVIELASAVAAATTMGITAYLTQSVASLLLGGLAAGAVRLVLSHFWLEGARFEFAWDDEARKEILSFGRWVFASTALTFVSMNVDSLSLGTLVPPADLGLYAIALMLASLPREVVNQLTQRVYYPVVSRVIREHGDIAQVRDLRMKLCMLLVVPVGCTVGASIPVIGFLYDDRYTSAGPLMAILSVGTWFSILEMTYGAITLARGEPRFITYGTAAKTVLFAAAVLPVFHAFGVEGVAALVSVSTLALVVALSFSARAAGVAMIGIDVVMTVSVLGCAAAAYFLHRGIEAATGSSLAGIVAIAVLALGVPGGLVATKRVRLLS
jgi:O-antigen/teichoic acid export membrane protein